MKVKSLFTLSLLLFGTTVSAQTISEDVALDKALSFMTPQKRGRGTTSNAQPKMQLAHKAMNQDETYYYVFNNADGGFVIIGGDEVAHDVLGYCDTGSFVYDELPSNLKWWLSEYETQISGAIKQVKKGLMVKTSSQESTPQHAPSGTSISPLLYTSDGHIEFHQQNPFNLAIDGGYGNFLAGCGPVAAAQIMRYFRYPSADTGIRVEAQSITTEGGNEYTAPAITSDYTYSWSNIYAKYSRNNYTLSEAQDVANLLYRIGRAVDAEFGSSATSSSLFTIGQKMIENFKYDKALVWQNRMYYSDLEWEQKIYDELKSGHPVLYGGQNAYGKGGHAFICDGYDASNGKFHFNWGWDGYCDGYFMMTGTGALTPKGSGDGGAGVNASYSRNQEILVGINRDQGNNYAENMCCDGYTIDKTAVAIGKKITLSGFIGYYGFNKFDGYVGLAFVDTEDPSKATYISRYPAEFDPFYGYDGLDEVSISSLTAGKTYKVYPAYSYGSDYYEWNLFTLPYGFEAPTIKVYSTWPIKGDVDEDGNINVGDVVKTRAYITGKNPSGFNNNAANMNDDSTVDDQDVELIRNIILNN